MLDNFANLVNNYKTKYKISIFSTIKCFETTITISKVTVLISLIDIVVSILLLKKRNQLSKATENTFIFKKKIDCLRLKLLQIAKKTITFKYYLNIVVINV